MKNHWLEVHRRKKNIIWTAEFSKNGLFVLQPRQVRVQDANYSLGQFSQNNGRIGVVFPGALNNTNDHELLDFLSESSQGGMTDMRTCLRKYNSIMSKTELERFELRDLSYESLGSGYNVDDIKLTFKFKNLSHSLNP